MTITNLSEIKLRIKDINADIPKLVSQAVRKITLDIDRNLTLATPVDTGRARANWQVTISKPASGVIDFDGGGDNNANKSAASAYSTNQTITALSAKMPEYPIVYITNNLDYIQRLNNGTSEQAPANFVETSIQAVKL